MKIFAKLMITVLLGVFMSLVIAAEEHRHDHGNSTEKLSLNQGEKWQIDNSLYLGMSNINQAVQAKLNDIHYDKFSSEQYLQLATQVDQQIAYLFEHCKLPPEADTQLHLLLAKIMRGSSMMKENKTPKQGAIFVIQALRDYPTYFNDKDWRGLDH